MEERTDGLILPEPVPSIRNEMFNQIDEPEVICLGIGKDWNYNDSSKDLPNPRIKDIQGKIIEDEQSLEGIMKNYNPQSKELVDQINESLKIKMEIHKKQWNKNGIYFVGKPSEKKLDIL